MIDRLKIYSDKKSADIITGKESIPPMLIIIRKSITRFIKCYISRKGYKEGKLGLLICLLNGIYPYVSALKSQKD